MGLGSVLQGTGWVAVRYYVQGGSGLQCGRVALRYYREDFICARSSIEEHVNADGLRY